MLFNIIIGAILLQNIVWASEDIEPKHPGKAGEETLLGIDSDNDGVRDDIEIWINNKTKDKPNIRMALKQIAKKTQLNIKAIENREESAKYQLQTEDAYECLRDLVSEKEYQDLLGPFKYEYFSTLDRIKADFKMRSSLDGKSFSVKENKTKADTCEFKPI